MMKPKQQGLQMADTPTNPDVTELVQMLLQTIQHLLDRMITFLEKMQDLLASLKNGQTQGELEEIIRMLIQNIDKHMEKLLSLLENLQARIVESFFPAQD